MLSNLDLQSPSPSRQPSPPTASPPTRTGDRTMGRLTDAALSDGEKDALIRQLEACWSPPAGAMEAEQLAVEVRVALDPDGSVREARAIDRSRMSRDAFYRAAAEAAERAVLRCSPLRVPPGKASIWSNMVINFDPREFL